MKILILFALLFLIACDDKKDQETPDPKKNIEQESATSSKEKEVKKITPDEFTKLSGEVSFTLDDGEELHRQFPDTFEIPEKSLRQNLKKGNIVKLVFLIKDETNSQTERMWVIVDEVKKNGYSGTLNNDPYCTDKIKSGLKVNFEAKHVISIYTAKE